MLIWGGNVFNDNFWFEKANIKITKNPAPTVGIYDKKVSLTVCKVAYIVILNKDLTIKGVILRGKII